MEAYLGIDVGSVTTKLAVLDGTDALGGSDSAVTVSLGKQGVQLSLGQRAVAAERLTAQPAHDGAFAIFNGHSYRGRFEFFRGKKDTLVVLNVVPLEDYLLGVVPSEMPANWPVEALRAQAVAAALQGVLESVGAGSPP